MSTSDSGDNRLIECSICSRKLRYSEQYIVNSNCDHLFCPQCAKYGQINDCPLCDERVVREQVKRRIRRPAIEYRCIDPKEVANIRDSINNSVEFIANLLVVTISGKVIHLVPPYGAKTRVCRIKETVEMMEGYKSDEHFLMYYNKCLDRIKTLDYYEIRDGSVLYMSKLLYVYCPQCTAISLIYYSYLNYSNLNHCRACAEALTISIIDLPSTDSDRVTGLEISIINPEPNNTENNEQNTGDTQQTSTTENRVIAIRSSIVSIEELFVRLGSGEVIRLPPLRFGKKTTIACIKLLIEVKTGIKPKQQLLSYQNRYLHDSRTLEYYNITERSIISVNRRMRRIKCFNVYEPLLRELCEELILVTPLEVSTGVSNIN